MSRPAASAQQPDPFTQTPPEVDLGPFKPPAGFAFEEEFAPATPRPVPAALNWGAWASGRRKKLLVAVEIGAVCVILARLGFVRELAPYVLPLKFLDWIGGAFLVVAAIAWLSQKSSPGRFRYVKEGRPVAARITGASVVADSAIEGMASYKAIFFFEAARPGTDKIEPHSCLSDPIQMAATKQPPAFELGHKAGDYATAVYLEKAKPGERMKLYSCLGLNPALVAFKRAGAAPALAGYATGLAVAFCVAAILGLALFALWAGQFHPLVDGNESGFVWTMLVGGVGFGALSLVVGLALLRRGGAKPTRRDYVRRTIWAGGGGGLLGAMFLTLGPSLYLNALLDEGQPEHKIVVVKDFWETTHSGLFREYSVEYFENGGAGATKKLSASYKKLEQFREGDGRAAIAYREGGFGWRWIEGIYPVVHRMAGDLLGGPIVGAMVKDGDEIVEGFFHGDEFHELSRGVARLVGEDGEAAE
jgi:hypothetical protein